jgi:hypothetical protein
MGAVKRSLTLLLVLAVLLGTGLPVAAERTEGRPPEPLPISEPTTLQKTGDVLIARPLLALRFVVAVVSFPIAWPVGAVLGDSGWAVEACLKAPWNQLVDRPIGRL